MKIRDLTPSEQAVVVEVANELAEIRDQMTAKDVELRRVLRAMEPRFVEDNVHFKGMAFWELATSVPSGDVEGNPTLQLQE